jgi:hypothetical protein
VGNRLPHTEDEDEGIEISTEYNGGYIRLLFRVVNRIITIVAKIFC